jgi:hypothetical protein
MRPDEKTFEGWQEIYFARHQNADRFAAQPFLKETRLEVLENLAFTARTRGEWSEVFRIATDCEGFSVLDPFCILCTTGIVYAPDPGSEQKWSERILNHLHEGIRKRWPFRTR